jgi:hypothetical protein
MMQERHSPLQGSVEFTETSPLLDVGSTLSYTSLTPGCWLNPPRGKERRPEGQEGEPQNKVNAGDANVVFTDRGRDSSGVFGEGQEVAHVAPLIHMPFCGARAEECLGHARW